MKHQGCLVLLKEFKQEHAAKKLWQWSNKLYGREQQTVGSGVQMLLLCAQLY